MNKGSYYSRSVRRSESAGDYEPNDNHDSLQGSSSAFYDSSVLVSPGNNSEENRARKTKLEKIKELLDENRKLKETTWHLQQQLNQKELEMKNNRYNQVMSSKDMKEGKPHEKHIEALRALTAVTKTQQESLAAHHERHEILSREVEEREHESIRLRKDLHKKKKEVMMLEKEIDSNLLEITGLRKELAQALQKSERSESEIRSDRRKMLELTRELALLKSGQRGATNGAVENKINAFDDEIRKKDEEIESQRRELEKQAARIEQLYQELEQTQDQVEEYEKERDATVADMEVYYEALKHELEEKGRLLEEAEREKNEMDMETTAALRALEERCHQLNTEVLDAHDELSILRRENDATNFASVKSESAQQEWDEERQRLNSNLEAMSTELNNLKQRQEEMVLEHAKACEDLEQENAELKLQQAEFKGALREANVRNREISERNEMMNTENQSLQEIARDLRLKLREEQASKEADPIVQNDAGQPNSDQFPQDAESPLHESASQSSMSFSYVNLEPVAEDNRSQTSGGFDADKGIGSGSTCSGDDSVIDPPASFEEEPSGQAALLQAATQAKAPDEGPMGQQALLLAAAAGRKTKKDPPDEPSTSGWRTMRGLRKRGQSNNELPPLTGSGRSSPTASTTADTEIEKLEKVIKEQKETIKKLQSELVRLNAFYRDAAYLNKRKMETLTQENAAYEIKIAVLENMLEKIGGAPDTHSSAGSVGEADDGNGSVDSGTASHDDATPQRDWSSPPKYLDRIKELEGKVTTLEKEKNHAEAKMKEAESNLESCKETAKRAALDSLLEIERLKRENAEKERRLLQ